MSETPDSSPLPTRIFGALCGFQRTAALKAAIELDIFTIISGGRASVEEIAVACAASPRGIRALCDVICLTGLLHKESGKYLLSAEAEHFLDRHSPKYMATDAVAAFADGGVEKGYENLSAAVCRGAPRSLLRVL